MTLKPLGHRLGRAALSAFAAVSASLLVCVGPVAGALQVTVPRGLEVDPPYPANNPPTPERVDLGRRLFLDRALSADRTVSCSSCHRLEHFFADTAAISPGVYSRRGHRNAPTLLNVAYARYLTWDGRSTTLEEQVLKPIQDPVEMDLSLDSLVARLSMVDDYRNGFREAYSESVSADGVARALASYLRTLRSGDAPVDRPGTGEQGAMTPAARVGYQLFVGKARCWICHGGVMFSDGEFHNTGVTARSGSDDAGRYSRTGAAIDLRAFRTASLRDVARTAPYMHDGSIATLEEVIDFYDDGGGPDPQSDAELRPLQLAASEKAALVAFLRSLDGA